MFKVKIHESITKMDLDFPYIIGTFEDGSKYRYDINEMVPERPEYKQLLNKEYFLKAELSPGGMAISVMIK
jgi:hypothetical protein